MYIVNDMFMLELPHGSFIILFSCITQELLFVLVVGSAYARMQLEL